MTSEPEVGDPMTSAFRASLLSCLTGEPGQPSQANKAMEQVRRFYEEAKKRAPGDAVEWAKEDIQRSGDWEYRVVVLPEGEAGALEAQLNEYGEERWEVFWVDTEGGDLRILLKRPSKSYLRSIPLSQLGKAISGDGSSE